MGGFPAAERREEREDKVRIPAKQKFIAAVALLFLLPFLLLSRQFIYGEKEIQQRDAVAFLELRAVTAASIISDVLNLNYSLNRIAGTAVPGGAAAVKKELGERVKQNPFVYSELALLSASGSELARFSAYKEPGQRLDYSKSDVFAAAKKTSAPAGAVEYGEYTPPALVLAEPLYRNGTPAYYAAGRLSLGYLGEVVRTMGRNSYGSFGLLDMGGQIIADSQSMSIVRPGLKAPPEVLNMVLAAAKRESSSFSGETRFRGRTLLAAVSNVPGSMWWVYEIVDPARLPSRTGSFWAWRVVLSGVGLILAFSVITWMLARRWLSGEDAGAGA